MNSGNSSQKSTPLWARDISPGCGEVPEKGKTTAELDPEEKNEISHRGNALRLMKDVIRKHRENN